MMKWIKTIVIATIGVATVCLVRTWAMPPAWWMGSMLSSGETTEQIAREHFGPILLQRHWLNDEGMNQDDALAAWGQFETLYRFCAIVVMQFILTSAAIVMIGKGSANNRVESLGDSPAASPRQSR